MTQKIRLILSLITCLVCWSQAQIPDFSLDFESLPKDRTTQGIQGKALNLSSTAQDRTGLGFPSPIAERNFSVVLWVNGEMEMQNSYEILSTQAPLPKDSSTTSGWTIGVQQNGAWFWKGQSTKKTYAYLPPTSRQSIRDGKWHLVAFTYSDDKQEIRFYHDGRNTAIYSVPEFHASDLKGDSLYLGGKPFRGIDAYNGFQNMPERLTFPGALDEIQIYNSLLSAENIASIYDRYLPDQRVEGPLLMGDSFKSMNFNIRMGGHETGEEVGVHRVAEVIRESGADIVTLQETYGSGPEIADLLGYYFYLRGTNLSILSRYPIAETLKAYHPFNNAGAYIQLKKDFKVAVFANWFPYPVDYWDLMEKNQKIDVADLMKKIDETTTREIRETFAVIQPYIDDAQEIPVIFSGDFNSGSHLDYTRATRKLHSGYIFPFTSSRFLLDQGFKDSFRELHPDPLKNPGTTWSPMFPKAYQERIDFIYYKGRKLQAISSEVISSHPVKYPSDHATVVTTFKMTP